MSKKPMSSPMDGLKTEPPKPSPIDKANATDLEPTKGTVSDLDKGEPKPEDKDPLFPAADNIQEDVFGFVPTTGTRISHVVEAVMLGLMSLLRMPPPPPGGAGTLLLKQSYYNSLSPEAKQFFVNMKDVQQEPPADKG